MKQLTITSEPCGHWFSGGETSFGALASKKRCVTCIDRADTANVNTFVTHCPEVHSGGNYSNEMTVVHAFRSTTAASLVATRLRSISAFPRLTHRLTSTNTSVSTGHCRSA